MLSKISLILFVALLVGKVYGEEAPNFAPDAYQYYDQTRSLDEASQIVKRSKETRHQFKNERFVASAGEDNWAELESLWKSYESNPLWATDRAFKEDL